MADRVAVMNDGRIEQLGTPDEVYRRPVSPFVAEFVGVVNRLPAVVTRDGVEFLGRSVAISADGRRPGEEVDLLIRPEDVAVSADAGGEGTVRTAVLRGAMSSLELELVGATGPVRVDLSSAAARRFEPGQRVHVEIDSRGATLDERRPRTAQREETA
jgi:putative spermidine/putrescine transport system ATP-binding protein